MTEEELAQKFFDIFQNAFPNEVQSYEKVTPNGLALLLASGSKLFFLWYNDNNWSLNCVV